jgi:hypothetical protein
MADVQGLQNFTPVLVFPVLWLEATFEPGGLERRNGVRDGPLARCPRRARSITTGQEHHGERLWIPGTELHDTALGEVEDSHTDRPGALAVT